MCIPCFFFVVIIRLLDTLYCSFSLTCALLPVYELYVGMYDKKKEQIYDMYTCFEHTCQVLKYFEYRSVPLINSSHLPTSYLLH